MTTTRGRAARQESKPTCGESSDGTTGNVTTDSFPFTERGQTAIPQTASGRDTPPPDCLGVVGAGGVAGDVEDELKRDL
jgi:hypothetical protein